MRLQQLGEDRLLDELYRNVVMVRQLAVKERFSQLHIITREAQEEGDPRVQSYQELAVQNSRLRNSLDRAQKRQGTRK